MTARPELEVQQDYVVQACAPGDLSEADMAACIAIVKAGEAVDPESAATELPQAAVLAIVRRGGQIVGVGAIKRVRPAYAAGRGRLSGHDFPADTQELGYVAVALEHRGCHLSPKIVAVLLAQHKGPLFATTDSDRMKNVLSKAGFEHNGDEWKGNRGPLSLWTKD